MLTSAAGYLIPMAVNFFATPLLLRGLGEAGYGLQNLVGVVTGYLIIMDLGLDIPIVKFLAEDHAIGNKESENALLSTTLQLYAVIGLGGMVAIMLMANVLATRVFKIPPDLVDASRFVFMLAGVGFLAYVFISWGRAVASGLQRYDIPNLISVVTNLAATVIGLAAVFAGFGVVGYVSVRIAGHLLSAAAYWISVRRLLPGFHFVWGIKRIVLKRIQGYVGSGLTLRFSGLLSNGLDRILIGTWLGVAAVGAYAVPLLIFNSLVYMIANVLNFTFPMASELYSTKQVDQLRSVYTRTSRFLAGIASLIFPLLFIFGDQFLNLWVESIAGQVIGVFRLMLLAGYISMLTVTLANNVAVGTGHIREFTIYIISRSLVITIGYLLLIRPFGLEGAGWALLIGGAVEIIFTLYIVKRCLKINLGTLLRETYVKPLLLGVALALLSFSFRPYSQSWIGLILVTSLAALVYLMVSYRLGIFGETEKRAVIGIWQLAVSHLKRNEGKA